jgi:hypothetical protein
MNGRGSLRLTRRSRTPPHSLRGGRPVPLPQLTHLSLPKYGYLPPQVDDPGRFGRRGDSTLDLPNARSGNRELTFGDWKLA